MTDVAVERCVSRGKEESTKDTDNKTGKEINVLFSDCSNRFQFTIILCKVQSDLLSFGSVSNSVQ